jgi:hypothetical protein
MRIIFSVSIVFVAVFIDACGGETATTKNAGNSSTASSGANSGQNANAFTTTKTPEAATTNTGESIAPVVEGYCAALRKKDETGLKKFLSQAAIKYWETESKSDKQPILKLIADVEEPLDEKREVRNEKITGETAIAELKGGPYGVWTKVKFIKENGEWKFASPLDSPENLSK